MKAVRKRRRNEIDWTKPFKGCNGATKYEFVRTVPDAGEFCHVIKSVKKRGLVRMVNAYGDDIGGARLISQARPKKEQAPKKAVAVNQAESDMVLINRKIHDTAHVTREEIKALRAELQTHMKESSSFLADIDMMARDMRRMLWHLSDDEKHGRVESSHTTSSTPLMDRLEKLEDETETDSELLASTNPIGWNQLGRYRLTKNENGQGREWP